MTDGKKKIPKKLREETLKLRKKQQRLGELVQQRQNLKGQLTETENALKEVRDAEEGEEMYEITGAVMIKKEKEELEEDLEDKKDILKLRVKRLKERIEDLKEELKDRRKELSKKIRGSGISG